MSQKTIERLLKVCARAISRMDTTMSYDRTIEAIIRLAEVVHGTETDENAWYLESEGIDLGSLIVGAYWFCADHHWGQGSPEYRALSALGGIYRPGCSSGPEPESTEANVYDLLEHMLGINL